MQYSLPNDETLIDLFINIKKIAVIGLSRSAVGSPVSVLNIHFQIDLVDVFRASRYVAEITDQCIDKKVKAMWLQEGVIDEVSAAKACSKNIFTVMDKCIYKEYIRLMK